MRRFLLGTTCFVAIAVAGGLGAQPAHAGDTHSEIALNQTLKSTLANGDIGFTPLQIPKFNTAQGNLTSVMVFENLAGAYHGSIYDKSAPTYAATVKISGGSNVVMRNGPTPLDGTGSRSIVGPLSISGLATTVTGIGPTTAPTPGKFSFTGKATHNFAVAPSHFRTFETAGAGHTMVDLSTTTVFGGQPTGYVFTNLDAKLTAHFTVAYGYTSPTPDSAPEPASSLMLGAGVIALGAARRRRK